jgi:arylsulfatase A-like enzyme
MGRVQGVVEQHPDIVLVVVDTARRDRFGCYGYGRSTTPTIDSLAGAGSRVDTMIANAPWTLPSHGSLFTGLYPSQHGAQWQTGPTFNDGVELTLAELLRDAGYETVCATNNGLISARTGLARGFDRYAFRMDLEQGWRRKARRARKLLAGGDSGGRVVNRWIREQVRDVRKPLFLFVNYLEGHWSYTPPRHLQRAVGGPQLGFLRDLRYRIELADRVGPWEAIARADDDTLAVYSALYDAEHRNVDGHVSELMDTLEAAGRLREGEVLVIVTSDHGEHIGEQGLADHHASLDDLLLRVPFVTWGPGLVPATPRQGTYEFVDVMPSLARLLDLEIPVPYLSDRRNDLFHANGASSFGDVAFAEWRSWTDKELTRLRARNPSYDFSKLGRDLVCARSSRYKLVRAGDGSESLFDLENDPGEEVDVAAEHGQERADLSEALDRQVASWRDWRSTTDQLSDEDAKEIERHLSELGYI